MAEMIKKRRWKGWIGFSTGLLVAGVLISHMIWSTTSRSRLQNRIDALRQAGEPILPADFAPINPGGADNAAMDIEAAGALIGRNDPAWAAFNKLAPKLPLRPDERETIAAGLRQSAAALERLELARNKPRMERDRDLTSPVIRTLVDRHVDNTRALVNLLNYAALLDHEQGNDASAMQRLEDLVPRYLPAVPIDPMAPGEQPIRYIPRPQNPIVYSVGLNGINDGGSEAAARTEYAQVGEWAIEDRVMHLVRQPRPDETPVPDLVPVPAPATQPQER